MLSRLKNKECKRGLQSDFLSGIKFLVNFWFQLDEIYWRPNHLNNKLVQETIHIALSYVLERNGENLSQSFIVSTREV